MARAHLSVIFESIQGRLGDLVFRRRGNKVFVGLKPEPTKRDPTPSQRKRRELFSKALQYVKRISTHPEKRAPYEEAARARRKRLRDVMMADFLNQPRVKQIDTSDYTGSPGDVIMISASDDLQVAGVRVQLTDVDGAVIEEGEASDLPYGSKWAYATTETVPANTTIRILATATDLPGGSHTWETEVQV